MGIDLGVFRGPLALERNVEARHLLAHALEDHHDVEGGAAAEAKQQHFHGADADVAATGIRRTIHHHGMARA